MTGIGTTTGAEEGEAERAASETEMVVERARSRDDPGAMEARVVAKIGEREAKVAMPSTRPGYMFPTYRDTCVRMSYGRYSKITVKFSA